MRHALIIGLAILTSLHVIACGSAGDAEPHSEETPASESLIVAPPASDGLADGAAPARTTVVASAQTTAETGVVVWDILQNAAGYAVTGQGSSGEDLVAFRVVVAPKACDADGGEGAAVVVSRTDVGAGMQSIDCSGTVTADTFDEATQAFWAALSVDGASALPRPTTPADFYCPQAFCGCEIKTDVKCYGVVGICINHNGNCTTSKPHLCGACFGFSW